MAFAEDLSAFFSTAEFAVAATYDGTVSVNVIFDREYIDSLTGIAGTAPHALAKASEIPAAGVNKTLVIEGTTYMIRNREPQDDGKLVLLRLEAA